MDLPSSYWRNLTPYPFDLHWIAITGIPELASSGNYSVDAGPVRTMKANIALSSEGDVNYIRTMGATFMAPSRVHRYHVGRYAVGNCLKFVGYPIIPADTGLEVSVRNANISSWNYGYRYPSCLFNGFVLPDGELGARNPAHLAGVGKAERLPASGVLPLDCADLQNDGRHDLHLVEMILNDVKGDDGYDGYGKAALEIEWLVNPTTGPLRMPEGEHIPLGNICPFDDPQYAGSRFFGGSGAWTYEFPPGTLMMPRQRLALELRNLTAETQSYNISLFGYLEVS